MASNLSTRLLYLDSKRPSWNCSYLQNQIVPRPVTNSRLYFKSGSLVPAQALSSAHIVGLRVVPNSITTNSLTISAGSTFTNIGGEYPIVLSTITKTLSTWSYGGSGGILGSALTTGTYHVFALFNPVSRQADLGLDSSINAVNRPSGWAARRLTSINVAGGNFVPFNQFGGYCELKTRTTPLGDTWSPGSYGQGNLYNSAQTNVALVGPPNGVKTLVSLTVTAGLPVANGSFAISLGQNAPTPSGTPLFGNFNGHVGSYWYVNGNDFMLAGTALQADFLVTDQNAQITWRSNGTIQSSGAYPTLLLHGWRDFKVWEGL